jgi:hypothetical protein
MDSDNIIYLIPVIFLIVLLGGAVFDLNTYWTDINSEIEKTSYIVENSGLTIFNASMDSPLVVIKTNSIDELLQISKDSGNSIIYKTSRLSYATIINATIGYSFEVEVEHKLWWIW